MVRTYCRDAIQAAIDRKKRKLSACLQKCSRCWLLIVAPGDAPSSFLDPSPQTREWAYAFQFDRVFYLNAFSGDWFELRREGLGAALRPSRDRASRA